MNLRKDKKVVHVGIALDESGSMSGVKRETLSGLNEQIQELKKHSDIDSTITLVTFAGDKDVKVKYSAVPISEIDTIKEEDYNPNGSTAMYDGVARLLNELQQKVVDNDETTYLVLIVSDGEENASKEYNSSKIAEMIKTRQETKKWTVSYLGANQDLTIVQQTLGLSAGNYFKYTGDVAGTQLMWTTSSNSIGNYMKARASYTTGEAIKCGTLTSNFIAPVNTVSDTTTDIPPLSN
jgi:uncharacterized protein YegL